VCVHLPPTRFCAKIVSQLAERALRGSETQNVIVDQGDKIGVLYLQEDLCQGARVNWLFSGCARQAFCLWGKG
jgi:hypothetical protein